MTETDATAPSMRSITTATPGTTGIPSLLRAMMSCRWPANALEIASAMRELIQLPMKA